MKIVSVINYKGGVGKTSVTANLGAELGWRGFKVLLVDLDAQSSLTFSFIEPDVWETDFAQNRTIKSWFDSFEGGSSNSLPDLVDNPFRVNSRIKGVVSLIYSHLALINVDLELATHLGGSNLAQAKRNFISVHRRMADGLRDFDDDSYDVILIDCPPNFNIVTKTAIIASDYILVPTRPDSLSTMGIDYLVRSVNALVKDYNDFISVESSDNFDPIDPKIMGIVFTMIQEYREQPISAHREFMERTKSESGIHVFDSYIKRNDTLFAATPQYGVPVVLHSHHNPSHKSVVKSLESVTSEFVNAIGLRT